MGGSEDAAIAFGSSPLARGLRIRWAWEALWFRIIPARAGFTCTAGRITASGRDHPRSRGVYAVASITGTLPAGSSPLARGLPMGRAMSLALRGIIPARAGFTSAPSRSGRAPRDHPRSRGVYYSDNGETAWLPGSSPLARGLRGGRLRPDHHRRIIPARAGFTIPTFLGRFFTTDHPRSRGVYAAQVRRRRDPLGIIPARAGFTL